MRNYVQPGDILTFTAPADGVVGGGGYQIGQLFVVATHDAEEGAEFEGKVTGVFVLPKTAAQAWTEGALVYWDATNGVATTSSDGTLLIGCAAAAAANPSDHGVVRLNGVAQASEAGGAG